MNSIISVCLLSAAACGYSPIFNHTDPVRIPEGVAIENENALTCKMEFQSHTICADFIWLKEPRGSDEGSMKIYFWHKDQPGVFTALENIQPGVKLWMPDMGHGSQKVKLSESKDANGQTLPGVYDATEVMFVMGGNWEIQFQLKDLSGNILEVQKLPYHAH